MTSLQSKKVSVVIPNYNYAKYIKKRIDSIVRQTYPIYELIVLDDCSTDNSLEAIEGTLKKVREEYPGLKVSFERNEKNNGKAISQWKKGFELATGDYVWIAEADDSCSRRFLEEAMKGFDDPDVVLSYSESMIINNWGMMIAPNFRWSRDKEKTGHYNKSYIKDGKKEIEEIMAIRCTIPNVSAVVFKKDKKYLKYLEEALNFSQTGDWYIYAKILDDGKISYNHKSLNKFRIHSGSVTSDSKRTRKHYDEVIEMHNYFKKKYNLSKAVISAIENEQKRIKARLG